MPRLPAETAIRRWRSRSGAIRSAGSRAPISASSCAIPGVAIGAALAVFLVRGSGKLAVLPVPTGPSPVGRASYDWVDESREEVFAPRQRGNGPGAKRKKRELMVWFWYPATPDPGAKPGAYLPGKWG